MKRPLPTPPKIQILSLLDSDMDLNSATDVGLLNVHASKRPLPTPPKVSSPKTPVSMFNNAQNTQITGGSFNITTKTTNLNTPNALDILHKRVAPNAILNAGGRADEVRCHPGTREEVINRIEKWRDAKDGQTPPIFWLSGPAGAGKSAIMQTIAERCKAQGVPQANFFFFRADGSRSNLPPLMATLLHQVIQLYPSLRDTIAGVFSDNPLILDSILEEQLAQLLVMPLRIIQQSSSSYSPLLVLIDGLDECDSENKHHQRQILHEFDKVCAEYPCPFRLLVASRDESQITSAFNEISSSLFPLYLDGEYYPEHDIRLFVRDQFKHVRKTHPLAHTLSATWPSVEDVNGIVKKSSGQFIYAATVMRFISDTSASPVVSLQRVQGAAQIATRSPFSYLDAIYSYILSQVDDQETLKDILHSQVLINDSRGNVELIELLQIHNPKYAEALVRSCLADLTSIAQYLDDGTLLFHHASFSDYLLDKSRSRDYFVDIDEFCFKIQPAVWKGIGWSPGVQSVAYYGLSRLKRLHPDFLNTLITLDPSKLKLFHIDTMVRPFEQIYTLCTRDDDVAKYKQIIRGWINILEDSDILKGCDGDERPPCSRRYFTMVYIERNPAMPLSAKTATALKTETDFDIRETGIWLDTLLHGIRREYYSCWTGVYQQLLKQWIFWAVQNDIPLDGLDKLPRSGRYSMMARIERDVSIQPRDETTVALRPESDFDARETSSWLNALLHRVHREIYRNNVQHYQHLLKGWISWAVLNGIPLDGLYDLPGAQRYLKKGRLERWLSRRMKFGRAKK